MNKNLLNIDIIRKYIMERKVYWTRHCINRLNKRNISTKDVKRTIMNGKIIEYYDKDYPYSSCLILGYSLDNLAIHIVCGIGEDLIYIITVYYPNNKEWEKDMKTRRKKQ